MTQETQAELLLDAYLDEVSSEPSWQRLRDPRQFATGQAILNADERTRLEVMCLALRPAPAPQRAFRASYQLIAWLCKSRLPYTLADIQRILQALTQTQWLHQLPAQALLRALARPLVDPETLSACQAALERLRTTASTWVNRYRIAESRKFLRLLDEILDGQQQRSVTIRPDDWGKQVIVLLEEMKPDLQEHWLTLLEHCAASGSTPSNKWLAQIPHLIAALGQEHFCRLVTSWLDAFGRNRGARLEEENANMLRGLAWCCAHLEDAQVAASLADAAIEGYRKITGLGPRSPKIAGACIYTLKSMPNLQGAAQLERVRLNVKQPSYLQVLESALDEVAQQAGMTRADLEELTVPTFGFEQGNPRISIGSAVAEIQIVGLTAQLQWYDASGLPQKAEPAEVKRDHKAKVKELKRQCDDITRLLVAQRDRLERLPLSERSWSLAAWRERYLDHPLVGCVTRRLLWRFTDGKCVHDAIWLDGQLVGVDDQPLECSETTIVSPWHPILCDADTVLTWRIWLEQHEITQPFKQAHREIYLLTDAERTTRVYSNRFAAHILRQHQFHALATGRGWHNQLRLMVDDNYAPATLELPHWGVRAEFWVEGTGEEYGIDTNETGTYLYLATDQVRFYRIGAARNLAHAGGGGYRAASSWHQPEDDSAPLPLEHIPPLVLSEVLRDVDLFVGVASVGNDPTWYDGGHESRHQTYWHSYSFGELSATAETRKHLLGRLLPKLAIADRCCIEGRFLKVRGELRTYKIHLGSGNILMEPNDHYLCIVPGQSKARTTWEGVFLPFEGDTVFSIILSKAFLLAADTDISDPTITRQIRGTY
jgi:hypothetical protein